MIITNLFQIALSINLAAILILTYQYTIISKEVVYHDYYTGQTLTQIQNIDNINNQIFPILEKISTTPDLRVYRYLDTANCPIDLSEEQCNVETCNAFYGDDDAPVRTVDLTYIAEKYTGQQGQNVWLSIYEQLESESKSEVHNHFINLIKGIHSSISVTISEQFEEADQIKPQVDFFFWRVGNYPDRIFNLYFLQQFLIKASKYLDLAHLSMLPKSDELMSDLFTILRQQKEQQFNYFDQITPEELAQSKEDIQLLYNYMDCVHCKRCKVNGKLQIHGLQTAINLLFDESTRTLDEKYDLVAFTNTFHKISQSIHSIDLMFQRKQDSFYATLKLSLQSYFILLAFHFAIASVIKLSKKK